jgi:hypothetical protein
MCITEGNFKSVLNIELSSVGLGQFNESSGPIGFEADGAGAKEPIRDFVSEA